MDLIAGRTQIFRAAQPRRPGADHADRLPARGPGVERLDPAFIPRGIGDELFDRADRDRAVAGEFGDAIALAQPILWADAATNFGHGRRAVAQLIRLAHAALGGPPQPIGDVIVERRSEEHTSELQSLMRNSYAVFRLKKTKN